MSSTPSDKQGYEIIFSSDLENKPEKPAHFSRATIFGNIAEEIKNLIKKGDYDLRTDDTPVLELFKETIGSTLKRAYGKHEFGFYCLVGSDKAEESILQLLYEQDLPQEAIAYSRNFFEKKKQESTKVTITFALNSNPDAEELIWKFLDAVAESCGGQRDMNPENLVGSSFIAESRVYFFGNIIDGSSKGLSLEVSNSNLLEG